MTSAMQVLSREETRRGRTLSREEARDVLGDTLFDLLRRERQAAANCGALRLANDGWSPITRYKALYTLANGQVVVEL